MKNSILGGPPCLWKTPRFRFRAGNWVPKNYTLLRSQGSVLGTRRPPVSFGRSWNRWGRTENRSGQTENRWGRTENRWGQTENRWERTENRWGRAENKWTHQVPFPSYPLFWFSFVSKFFVCYKDFKWTILCQTHTKPQHEVRSCIQWGTKSTQPLGCDVRKNRV